MAFAAKKLFEWDNLANIVISLLDLFYILLKKWGRTMQCARGE